MVVVVVVARRRIYNPLFSLEEESIQGVMEGRSYWEFPNVNMNAYSDSTCMNVSVAEAEKDVRV